MIILIPMTAFASSWSGTSTTYGNTTYHNFHSSGIQVIPAAEHHHYHQDNTAAVAAGAAIGVVVGVLLVKGIKECFKKKPKPLENGAWVWNYEIGQWEYFAY